VHGQQLEDDGWLVHLATAREAVRRLEPALERRDATPDELADAGGALSVLYCVLGPRAAETVAWEKRYTTAAAQRRKKEMVAIRTAVGRMVAGAKEAERRGLWEDAARLLDEAIYLVPEGESLRGELEVSLQALEKRQVAARVRRIEGALAEARRALAEGKVSRADNELWRARELLDAGRWREESDTAALRQKLDAVQDDVDVARRAFELARARRYQRVAAKLERQRRYGDAMFVWEIIHSTRSNELGPSAAETLSAEAERQRIEQLRDGLDAAAGLTLVRRGEDALGRGAWAEARGLLEDGASVLSRLNAGDAQQERAWNLMERIELRCERAAAGCALEGLDVDRGATKGEEMVGMRSTATDPEEMIGARDFAGALLDRLSLPAEARLRYGLASCAEIAAGGRVRGVQERRRDVMELRGRLDQIARSQRDPAALERSRAPTEVALRSALIKLAAAQSQSGDDDDALATLAEARALPDADPAHLSARVEALRLEGRLALERRDLPAARAAAEQALALVPDPADVRRPSLQNALALVALAERRPADAQRLIEDALAARERVLGGTHPFLTSYLNNLAVSRWQQGDPSGARAHLSRAQEIWSAAFGEQHPGSLALLTNVAILQRASGDLSGARASHLRALALAEGAMGPVHPTVATILENLASVPWEEGNLAETRALLERVAAIQTHLLDLRMGAHHGGEASRLAFAESLQRTTDTLISLHGGLGADDTATGRLAFEALLQRKARVLELWVDATRADADGAQSAEVSALLIRWRKATNAWSSAALRGPAPSQEPAAFRAELQRLQHEADTVAGALAARSAAFGRGRGPVTVEALQASLPPDAALVELAVYRPYQILARTEPEAWGPPRYVAWILLREGEPRRVELGEVEEVDAEVTRLRAAIVGCGQEAQPCVASLAQSLEVGGRLYERLMAPVLAVAGERRHLLVAPDGGLHLLPFDALVTPRGFYLMEERLITLLDSGRDLLRARSGAPPRGPAALVADPDFGPPVGKELRLGGAPLLMAWSRLPGTAAEVDEVSRRLRGSDADDATVVIGPQASETWVRGLHGPRLLHLATHGFFLAERGGGSRAGAVPESRGFVSSGVAQMGTGEGAVSASDPMLRSGLLFANANRWDDQPERDGVLTAREVAGLDLAGTRLVVLSACETGLGEARRSQGVFGLRRAFAMAGAETLVMSLYPVPDEATAALMTAFYEALVAGAGRSQAMRQARLTLLSDAATSAPLFWSAFVVAGDWRTLAGEAAPPFEAAPRRPPMDAELFRVTPGPRGCACQHPAAQAPTRGLPWALGLAALAVGGSLRRR